MLMPNCVGLFSHVRDNRWQQEVRYLSQRSRPSHCGATSHRTEEAKGNNGRKEPGIHTKYDKAFLHYLQHSSFFP